jgi:hypothetical protein
VRHQFDLAHGTHVDYHCACGQRLQWDHPLKAIAPAAFLIGGPHPCEHAALYTPEALFPRAGPGTMEWPTERTEEPSTWMSGARREAEKVVFHERGKSAPECDSASRHTLPPNTLGQGGYPERLR